MAEFFITSPDSPGFFESSSFQNNAWQVRKNQLSSRRLSSLLFGLPFIKFICVFGYRKPLLLCPLNVIYLCKVFGENWLDPRTVLWQSISTILGSPQTAACLSLILPPDLPIPIAIFEVETEGKRLNNKQREHSSSNWIWWPAILCNFYLQLSVCMHNWPQGKQAELGQVAGPSRIDGQIPQPACPKIVEIFLYFMRQVDVNEKLENSEMLSAFGQQMYQLYLDWISAKYSLNSRSPYLLESRYIYPKSLLMIYSN